MYRLTIVEGLPRSGKSTAARYIAERTGAMFFDEDCGNHPADYEYHAFITDEQLRGFDGYIAALEERRRRELNILRGLDIPYIIIKDPEKDRDIAYRQIMEKIGI